MHANVLLFYTPLTPVWRQKVKKKSEEGYGAHHIMQLNYLIVCTPWPFADKHNLIELSDLIGCGYDLSDIQEWDLYFVVNILSS